MRPRLLTMLAGSALAAFAVAPAAPAAAKKHKLVNGIFQGTVKSVSTSKGRVEMNVTGANVYGRKLVKKSWKFDLRKAALELGDANGDGKANIGDVATGHIISVTAKVPKKGAFPKTIKAQAFTDLSALVTIPSVSP
jgi:hypothetical protein